MSTLKRRATPGTVLFCDKSGEVVALTITSVSTSMSMMSGHALGLMISARAGTPVTGLVAPGLIRSVYTEVKQ